MNILQLKSKPADGKNNKAMSELKSNKDFRQFSDSLETCQRKRTPTQDSEFRIVEWAEWAGHLACGRIDIIAWPRQKFTGIHGTTTITTIVAGEA
ncbi:uncharacterized protein Dyak_GE28672 [Drosophila yakuba]|uniref:Uncharacterized protein n=1 Tax=Drosophila yakuba TaxID=7245 RepID=A0A0R1EAF2_DROYA|nr:uncharacterized protein Dyak_GE28672 [Drosophila yakuba]